MPTGQRQTHIERVYGIGRNSDLWVDIEVLDEFMEQGERKQNTVHKFVCDPKKESTRNGTVIRVENPDDPDRYVDVIVWDRYKTTERERSFYNCPGDTTRQGSVRKIPNRDISDRSLDQDKQPPRDPKQYLKAIQQTNTTNEDNFVCVEIVSLWKESGTGTPPYRDVGADPWGGTIIGQNSNFKVETCNSEILPDKKDCERKSGGSSSRAANPNEPRRMGSDRTPVRMDPLQWIVNIDWGGLAVEFYASMKNDAATPPPQQPSP
jgi:hypothetical protein